MRKSSVVVIVMVLRSVTTAFADPMAIARAHDAAYDKATLAYDVKTMLIFYEDKAEAIYPGEGEVATDKAGIEKLIRNFISPWCSQGHEKPTLKEISFHAVPLGPDYIMIVRIVDATDTQGTVRGRATELIHRSGGKWRYLVDHASLGIAPQTSATTEAAPH